MAKWLFFRVGENGVGDILFVLFYSLFYTQWRSLFSHSEMSFLHAETTPLLYRRSCYLGCLSRYCTFFNAIIFSNIIQASPPRSRDHTLITVWGYPTLKFVFNTLCEPTISHPKMGIFGYFLGDGNFYLCKFANIFLRSLERTLLRTLNVL